LQKIDQGNLLDRPARKDPHATLSTDGLEKALALVEPEG
jgi:hypothetical protein